MRSRLIGRKPFFLNESMRKKTNIKFATIAGCKMIKTEAKSHSAIPFFSRFITLPSLAYAALIRMLQKDGEEIELISDENIYRFVQKGLRVRFGLFPFFHPEFLPKSPRAGSVKFFLSDAMLVLDQRTSANSYSQP